MPGLQLGDKFPDWEFETTAGKIKFHDWIGDSWVIFFSHPSAYTPVCTSEMAEACRIAPECEKLGVKIISFCIESVDKHKGWIDDIKNVSKGNCGFPLIGGTMDQAKQLGILDPKASTKTARCVYILGSDKTVKMALLYPLMTGRNFDEILRVLKSMKLTEVQKVGTPASWQPGEDCMLPPGMSDEDAKKLFPKGFTVQQVPSGKRYYRVTPDPSA